MVYRPPAKDKAGRSLQCNPAVYVAAMAPLSLGWLINTVTSDCHDRTNCETDDAEDHRTADQKPSRAERVDKRQNSAYSHGKQWRDQAQAKLTCLPNPIILFW
jgi:hypothetical protein